MLLHSKTSAAAITRLARKLSVWIAAGMLFVLGLYGGFQGWPTAAIDSTKPRTQTVLYQDTASLVDEDFLSRGSLLLRFRIYNSVCHTGEDLTLSESLVDHRLSRLLSLARQVVSRV